MTTHNPSFGQSLCRLKRLKPTFLEVYTIGEYKLGFGLPI